MTKHELPQLSFLFFSSYRAQPASIWVASIWMPIIFTGSLAKPPIRLSNTPLAHVDLTNPPIEAGSEETQTETQE